MTVLPEAVLEALRGTPMIVLQARDHILPVWLTRPIHVWTVIEVSGDARHCCYPWEMTC